MIACDNDATKAPWHTLNNTNETVIFRHFS